MRSSSGQQQVSRFNAYSGYSAPEFDGWRRYSQHVGVSDSTKLAVDYYRPIVGGALHRKALPVVELLHGPSRPSRVVLPVIPDV